MHSGYKTQHEQRISESIWEDQDYPRKSLWKRSGSDISLKLNEMGKKARTEKVPLIGAHCFL